MFGSAESCTIGDLQKAEVSKIMPSDGRTSQTGHKMRNIRRRPDLFKGLTWVASVVRNEHDAWDLAQESFLKAWQSIHRFKGRSSFYTWLYSIAVNLTIYSLRRKRRREEVELNDAIPSSLPCPGVNYQRSEIREHVNLALAKLSPEHRAVVVLKELEDLQYHEIAEVLNLSMGTVMSRLFYGRKKLQSMLRPIYNQIYRTRLPKSAAPNRANE
jgi:RNA polymerase sigma-70 factor, ECF subfamily